MLKYLPFLFLIAGALSQCQDSAASDTSVNTSSSTLDTINSAPSTSTLVRYKDMVFTEIDSLPNVVYGRNTNTQGNTLDLDMDIYFPKGDSLTQRPLMIWAHGGYFLYGDKKDGRDLCYQLAETGINCASINYRKWSSITTTPDTLEYIELVVQATLDMRAAIRYFYKEAETYGIDTNAIFIGGYSAGGFMANFAGYMDRLDEMPTHIRELVGQNGGLAGNSGNEGFSQNVIGVVSVAGAGYNTSMMKTGARPAFLAIHGNEDNVVPYRRGFAYGPDQQPVIRVDGGANLYDAAVQTGIPATLYTFEGGDHSEPWVSYHLGNDEMLNNGDITMQQIQNFIWERVTQKDEAGR